MIDGREQLTPRERRIAQKWLNRMLEDPERYRRGMSKWVTRTSAREAYYAKLMNTIASATLSARALPVQLPAQEPRLLGQLTIKNAALIMGFLAAGVLAAGFVIKIRKWDVSPFISVASAHTVLKTRVGEVRTERLADGTSILLDTDTVVVLETEAEHNVIELQRGRARFTRSAGASSSLVVHAGGFTIVQSGETFDVSYRGDLKIQPIKGDLKVETTPRAPDRAEQVITVRPGEILDFRRGQTSMPSASVARGSERQWVDGVKSFDNVPISEIIAEANGYSDRRLELADPSLGGRKLFAEINVRDIEMVAEAIAGFLELDIDRSHTNQLILVARK